MPKPPFQSNISKPTDADVFAATKGHPFGKCPNCFRPKVSSEDYCRECARLVEVGFGVTPRAPSTTIPDTQEAQSFDAFRHAGFSTKQPTKKFPVTKERF